MGSRLVQDGVKVIAVDRRKDNLDELVRWYGRDGASAIKFDVDNRHNMDFSVSE